MGLALRYGMGYGVKDAFRLCGDLCAGPSQSSLQRLQGMAHGEDSVTLQSAAFFFEKIEEGFADGVGEIVAHGAVFEFEGAAVFFTQAMASLSMPRGR